MHFFTNQIFMMDRRLKSKNNMPPLIVRDTKSMFGNEIGNQVPLIKKYEKLWN